MKKAIFGIVIICHIIIFFALFGSDKATDATTPAENQDQPENISEQQPETPPIPPATPDRPASDRTITTPIQQTGSSSLPSTKLTNIHWVDTSTRLPQDLAQIQKNFKAGILVDASSGKILWKYNENKVVPIASITKIMTGLLVAEEVRSNPSINLNTQIKVTRAASKIGGSQVYLDPRESFSIDDLLKCMMIFSANDASYLLAESFNGGSYDNFIKKMNNKAKALNLNTLKFYNSSGLPDKAGTNKGSVLEINKLGFIALHYPELVKHTSTRLSYIREKTKPFQLVSRNHLVGKVEGVNGMKTGYIQASGFCICITCERAGRLLVGTVAGFKTSRERDDFVKKLLNWGYTLPR